MAALYFRTNDAGGGLLWFRTNDASGSAHGIGQGASVSAAAPTGSALGYATVTLAAPLNFGPGSILNPQWFSGTPAPGDVVRYPRNHGFRVLPNGTVQCDINDGVFPCFYNDGGGEVAFSITLTPDVVAAGAGVTVSVVAPTGLATGGASGLGVTVSAVAPTGTAAPASPGDAMGQGVTVGATAPTGTGAGAALATGVGVTMNAYPPLAAAQGHDAPFVQSVARPFRRPLRRSLRRSLGR